MGLATRLGTDRQSFTEGELRIREQDFNVYEDGKENRKQEIYCIHENLGQGHALERTAGRQ